MSAPVTLALPALEVRLTDAGGGRVAVWLAAVGSDASERVATVVRDARRRGAWALADECEGADMPLPLEAAIEAALDAHFAAAP